MAAQLCAVHLLPLSRWRKNKSLPGKDCAISAPESKFFSPRANFLNFYYLLSNCHPHVWALSQSLFSTKQQECPKPFREQAQSLQRQSLPEAQEYKTLAAPQKNPRPSKWIASSTWKIQTHQVCHHWTTFYMYHTRLDRVPKLGFWIAETSSFLAFLLRVSHCWTTSTMSYKPLYSLNIYPYSSYHSISLKILIH